MNCFLRSSFVRIGCHIAGWSSWLARWPHEPKVADSSSAPATKVFFKLKWVKKIDTCRQLAREGRLLLKVLSCNRLYSF